MKKFVIKVTLGTDEYEAARKYYSDAEIRSILADGGLGELTNLLIAKDDMEHRAGATADPGDPVQDDLFSRATAWEDQPRAED